MKYLVEEHGDFGPFYIGLKADAGDSKKNLFEWDKPMGKSNLEVDISISSTESNWLEGGHRGILKHSKRDLLPFDGQVSGNPFGWPQLDPIKP